MKNRYLEITYRGGKALAAYLHLPRETSARTARSEAAGEGLVIDFDEIGRPIGLEITEPTEVSVEQINEVMERLGLPPVSPEELSPLSAA